MDIIHSDLEAVAVKKEQFPIQGYPEIVFVGRSNVGKSSLINSLLNRKALARVSQAPGKTRTINFYNIDDATFFVDLPGYGYAKAPKDEQAKWGKMIEAYLKGREEIKAILLLLDIRHSPSKQDLQMYEWLSYYGHEIIFVLTKSDKIKRSQLGKHIKIVMDALNVDDKSLFYPFSSLNKSGRDELLQAISKRL